MRKKQFNFFICPLLLAVFVFFCGSLAAQNKSSKYGTICGDAAKTECTEDEEIFKPFDLVFDAHDFDGNSSATLFSKYFYAVVLETVKGYKESGGCREISEAKRDAAQKLFPNNKAFTYNYYCRALGTGEYFIGYQGAGLTESTHFLAVYGGKTQAEAAKILSAAKKKYPKTKLVKMRAGIMFQGDVLRYKEEKKVVKIQSLTIILSLILFASGCGLADKFAATSDKNANLVASTPTPAAGATPSVAPSQSDDKSSLGRNLLAFGAGTNVVAFTSESQNSTNRAVQLIDESGSGEGWKTDEGQNTNQSVTLEFPARTTLEKIVFDTYFQGSNKNAPKDIRVEVSDTSATTGFQTILETTLNENPKNMNSAEQGLDNQIFPVTQKIAGRFLRLTVINNFGYDKNIFVKEMRGYGEQEPLPAQANISGTYQNWGGAIVHLKQEGAAVIGCNEQNDNIYEGTMNGRVFNYQARKADGKPEGIGFYSFSPDGQKINIMGYPYGKESFGLTGTGNKKSDKIGNCKFLPDLDGNGKDVVKDALEKNLNDSGRATLYGINFDFNSDVIKPDSKPTLDKVVSILKGKFDWKFSVEGHTDNVGGDAFNQTLSEKRAASVVKYLTDAGIDASRLNSKGFGLSKPVTANDSEAKRAQNRRVELVKQ